MPVVTVDDPREAFRFFDPDGSGRIGTEDLQAALARLGLSVSESEVTSKLRKRNYEVAGVLWRAFNLQQFELLVADVRVFVNEREAFRFFDRDGKGRVAVVDLRPALARLGLNASEADMASVLRNASWRNYETAGTAGLDIQQFYLLVADVRALLDVHQVFRFFHQDRSGRIDLNELRPALVRLGLDASDYEIAGILRNYETAGTAGLDIQQFERLVIDVRAFVAKKLP